MIQHERAVKFWFPQVSSGAELNKLHTVNPPPDVGDAYGTSVALGGTRIAVGAPGSASDTGSIYLYDTENLNWSRFRSATDSESEPGDKEGSSLAVSTTSVIGGAPGRMGGDDTGAVFIFSPDGFGVSPAALITAPGGDAGDHFGDAVTCASDGWPMLVGARGYEDDQGAVYIYSGPDDVAPVIVQPPDSSVDHVEFGYAVAYASGKFVVGARELGADKIGAAFLYSL